MSPLFPCSGCGLQIERSMRLYRDQKGIVLCSTCKDKLEVEADPAASPAPGAAQSQHHLGGVAQAADPG